MLESLHPVPIWHCNNYQPHKNSNFILTKLRNHLLFWGKIILVTWKNIQILSKIYTPLLWQSANRILHITVGYKIILKHNHNRTPVKLPLTGTLHSLRQSLRLRSEAVQLESSLPRNFSPMPDDPPDSTHGLFIVFSQFPHLFPDCPKLAYCTTQILP